MLIPGARELRLGDRLVALQPRIFDVLVYLVEHRDRVVTKDELLSSVWDDAIVSESSLKRSVSLLRTALREGGADPIRTYARQGYRFVAADLSHYDPGSSPETDALTTARTCFESGHWQEAAEAFAAADANDGLEALDLERWAESLQWAGGPWSAMPLLERATTAHSAAGDKCAAARAALGLAHLYYERAEVNIGKGWLGRARRLLEGQEQCRVHGLHAAISSRYDIAEAQFDQGIANAERAIEIGRRLDVEDVELLGQNYLGMALISKGDLPRGLAVHAEAAATAFTGDKSPLVAGLVYCGLIWTCRNRGDWRRAAEWADHFSRWCESSSVQAFAGTCRLHHAEVLHHLGDLESAEREARSACQVLSELAPYASGDGHRVLGDLRLARGDLKEAEEAYRRAHQAGWDPQPGLALIMVEQGQAPAAMRALDRSLSLGNWSNGQRRGLLLARMVTVAVAAGDTDRAQQAMAELEDLQGMASTTATTALTHEARAALLEVGGDVGGAIAELSRANHVWLEAGSPLHVAHNRLRLARLFMEAADYQAAELELSSAQSFLSSCGASGRLEELDEIAQELADKRPDA